MPDSSFFDERLEQSRIKAIIVSEYFWAWAKIIMPTAKKHDDRIAYIDLFAGPGRYKDGTKSTPVIVLEQAVQDVNMREMLVTMFNDMDKNNSASLQTAINEISGIYTLKYRPAIYTHEIGENIVKMFAEMSLVPTLFFVDPWGYKGLSLRLINSVLKNWGCDCIFFLNFNRINPGLSNAAVREHMDALFGERANALRQKIEALKPEERELTIVNELAQALKDMGGKYVLPFRFRNETGTRTSHHLIFVSKHFKGYHVMKGIMSKHSSSTEEGVPSFEYNPATERQPMLYAFRPRPLNDLKEALLRDFIGQQLTMGQIYERHSIDTRYVDKNYRDALRQLEAEGQIQVDPPADRRQKRNGEVTFADKVVVRFP